MLRTSFFALSALILATSGTQAQSYYPRTDTPGNPQTLVRSWYEHYLHREPDAGASAWVKSLSHNSSPEDVLASILSSQEYYALAGNSVPGFVRQLYLDILGREPSGSEITFWANRVRYESRKDVAYTLLSRHPQNWSGTAAPPPNYDPGYYPDPTSPTFRDPGGPYFRSFYFDNYEYRRPIRAFPLDSRG